MYYVYILFSEKCNRFYIGYSANPQKRLDERHNMGLVKATKNCRPYTLLKTKVFETETEARKEEYRIKAKKSAIYIKYLLDNDW